MITSGESGKTVKTDSYFQFSWHFSAKAPMVSGKDETDTIYGVSHRTIPEGPNPLHN